MAQIRGGYGSLCPGHPAGGAQWRFQLASTPITVPNTGDPAMNAKFAAAGLTPGAAFPNNTDPGIVDRSECRAVFVLPAPCLFRMRRATFSPARPAHPRTVPEVVLRFDHYFTDKLSLFGHYIHDNTDQVVADIPVE